MDRTRLTEYQVRSNGISPGSLDGYEMLDGSCRAHLFGKMEILE